MAVLFVLFMEEPLFDKSDVYIMAKLLRHSLNNPNLKKDGDYYFMKRLYTKIYGESKHK